MIGLRGEASTIYFSERLTMGSWLTPNGTQQKGGMVSSRIDMLPSRGEQNKRKVSLLLFVLHVDSTWLIPCPQEAVPLPKPNVEPDVSATTTFSRKFSAEILLPHRGLLRSDDLVSGL